MDLKNSTASSFDPQYWDETWGKRIIDNHHVEMNSPKLTFLMQQLWARAEYTYKEKLDVGCGTGIHAIRMKHLNPTWAEHWTGIDLSPKAAAWGKEKNINLVEGDIFTYNFNKTFDAFIFLDSLEHIQDHKALASKMLEIGNKGFSVLGNVPLYRSEHTEHFERDINIKVIGEFLNYCSYSSFWHEIYGINGYPYMIFEATR